MENPYLAIMQKLYFVSKMAMSFGLFLSILDFNEDTLVVTINGEQGVELNYKELSLSHFQIFNMLDCTISNRSSTW